MQSIAVPLCLPSDLPPKSSKKWIKVDHTAPELQDDRNRGYGYGYGRGQAHGSLIRSLQILRNIE